LSTTGAKSGRGADRRSGRTPPDDPHREIDSGIFTDEVEHADADVLNELREITQRLQALERRLGSREA